MVNGVVDIMSSVVLQSAVMGFLACFNLVEVHNEEIW